MKRLISLTAVAAVGCAWGAVSEYVRTVVTNFNGHVGCDLVTYVKPATAQRTGCIGNVALGAVWRPETRDKRPAETLRQRDG